MYLFRIITEKCYVKTLENEPTRTSSIQKLPKPTITTVKNNPTMNLMDFTFKPYTQVFI